MTEAAITKTHVQVQNTSNSASKQPNFSHTSIGENMYFSALIGTLLCHFPSTITKIQIEFTTLLYILL